jgi:hypothetical protein
MATRLLGHVDEGQWLDAGQRSRLKLWRAPPPRRRGNTMIWDFHEETDAHGGDLVGYSVEATDGSIGKIDEATYDAGSSYIVVDTGPWIFGTKVLLPAGVITAIDREEEVVTVARTKDEIKAAPEFDPDQSRDDAYRRPFGEYYSDF